MKIETYIDALISYGMNKGLTQPEDHIYLQNRLLEVLGLDEYIPSDELQPEELEEILSGLILPVEKDCAMIISPHVICLIQS